MTQWKRVGSATKPTITTNNTTPLSGNVMLSAYGKVATVAYFPAVTLQNPGDYIMVRCDLLYTAKQSINTTGPSLALYDSKGTQLTADHTGAADGTLPASLTDDRGYKAYKSFETANDLILFHNHLGFAPLRFNALNPTLNSIDTGATIALNTVYTMSLMIELAANGYDLVITSTFGGSSQTKTVAGTDVLTKTFDEIGVNLWAGDYSGSGVMDNVLVTTNRPTIPAGTTSSFHDNLDTGFTQWNRIGSATEPAIGTDNTSPLNGNVLQFNYCKAATVGYFKTVTLKWPGDYIKASYNVRYTAKQTTDTTGPTLALYHSQGTQLTADHTGAADGTLPASLTDDLGYKAYKSFETANDLVLFKNHLGFAPLSFTNLNTSLNAVGTGTGIALNSVHTLALKIELAANGADLLITSTFNGSTQTQTVTGADVLTKSFDEIGVNLWGGDFSGAGSLDNVVVFTNVNLPPGAAALGYTRVIIDERPKFADIAPGKTGNYKWFRGAVWTATQPPLSNFTETNGVLTIMQKADGTTNSLVGAPHDFVGGVFPRLEGLEGFYIEFDVSLSTNDTDHWPAVWLMPAEHNGGNGQPLGDVYPDIYPNDPPSYERWMELDVDEGGFRPGMLASVISWQGAYPNYSAVVSNSWIAGGAALDRTQRHIFGASYDPVHQRVTWWLDGVKFYTADNTVTAGCIPPVAEIQNFYPILGAQTHGPWKNPPTAAVPYSMYIHAVRAYSTAPIAPTVPAAPTGLTATAVSASQIDLVWTASSGADSYNVKRSTTSGGPYTTIATGVTGTTYANTGLSASTTYHYVVSASNATGESGDSAQASATTSSGSSSTTMHVFDLQVDRADVGKGKSKATAVVTIVDNSGNPVANASVTVSFTEAIVETKSGVTGSDGVVTITTDGSASNPAKTTGCVSNVSHATLTYNSAADVTSCDKTH